MNNSVYNYPTPEEVFSAPEIKAYITAGNDNLEAIGYTEHGFAHAKKSGDTAYSILYKLNHSRRTCELAAIAGYIHDIGNVINREDHSHSGALMAFTILNKLNMDPEEIAVVCAAIGHHDEKTAYPVNTVAAALIIADKSDVRRTRVRGNDLVGDIHDRVNFAVESSALDIDTKNNTCIFNIKIDTSICPIMEYFEIFLDRMVLCRRSAGVLGLDFELIINDTRLL
ncbi:MAG: HD domain-containing protein [Ruminococcaceae bacterium]|nr:HD domain-containing protein [Oscillospiraceae bacterium]